MATGSTFVMVGGRKLEEKILESQPDIELNYNPIEVGMQDQDDNDNDLPPNSCRKRATTPTTKRQRRKCDNGGSPSMLVAFREVSDHLASVMRDMVDKMPENPS